jgi:hypothetical protein
MYYGLGPMHIATASSSWLVVPSLTPWTADHTKRKRVEWLGFERYSSLITALSFGWIIISQKLAEVVGSTPTRSISFCVGNTVLK